MKNKTFYAVAIAVAFTMCYSAFQAYNKTRLTGMLLANIEAISMSEDESCISNSECPGPCSYANVGIVRGKTYDVVHFCDSIDIRTTYSYEKCYADGHGIMEGNDVIYYGVQMEKEECVKCEGERGHVHFPAL